MKGLEPRDNPSPEQVEVGRRISVGSMGGAPKTRNQRLTKRQKQLSSDLRRNATDAEGLLWWQLKSYRDNGFAFRRQAPIGPFVVDFLCRKANLIVEADGEHHGKGQQKTHDIERDDWLRSQGYTVLRFWNGDIFTDLSSVLDAIDETLTQQGCVPS